MKSTKEGNTKEIIHQLVSCSKWVRTRQYFLTSPTSQQEKHVEVKIMIQSIWSINNFKSYHPELQVSCMGASKMISHMQQHFRDGNNLLIALFVIPCLPMAAQPSQVQNCFLLPLAEPSRLSPGWKIVPWAHSEPQQWLSLGRTCPESPPNTPVMVVLQRW